MRILVVTNLYPNPFQPQRATFNRDQVCALSHVHEMSVISPISWTDEFAASRDGSPALPRGRRLELDGIPVDYPRSIHLPRVMRGSYGFVYLHSISKAFRHAAAAHRPELVYATWAYPDGWASVRLGHRAGCPVVLKVHGSDVLELEKYPGRKRGTVEALRRADRVVAVSRDLARKVVELGADPARVHLIYNGVDAELFSPGDRVDACQRLGIDPARAALLYVGNLLPVKGPDILIDACKMLADRGLTFDLHMIGRGPLRTNLERQSSVGQLAGRVRFHGVVPHDQLPDWFRAATMLVLPSRSEGVPNVLLEAAACGTPFVASRVGGVPEIAHMGISRLFDPEDPVQLADSVAEMLAQPSVSARHPRPARSHQNAAEELSAVFEAALGRDSTEAAHTIYREELRIFSTSINQSPCRSMDLNMKPPSSLILKKISKQPLAGVLAHPSQKSRIRQAVRNGLAAILPRSVYLTQGPKVSHSLCLTFDDGPDPEITPRLLDLLGNFQIPATFFPIGRCAEKYPSIIRRMATEGHSIGSHTYSHEITKRLSVRETAEDIRRGVHSIQEIVGKPAALYRPPRGKLTAMDLWGVWRAGLTIVLWNVDPKDYAKQTPNEILDWFQPRPCKSGDIVLFHDTYPYVLGVLPVLISAARNKGLTFTTVDAWTN